MMLTTPVQFNCSNSHCHHQTIRTHFTLNPKAIQTFRHLFHLFTSAPILLIQILLAAFGEVQTKNCIPAVSSLENLTSHSSETGQGIMKIWPSIVLKRNGITGDQFIVWMDHQNLITIQQAKRLNPQQACWVLFFEQFNFILSYRSGSKNTKIDALSCQQMESPQTDPVPVLSPHLILSPIWWESGRGMSWDPLLLIHHLAVSMSQLVCTLTPSSGPNPLVSAGHTGTSRFHQQLECFRICNIIWETLHNILTSFDPRLSPFEVCNSFQPPMFDHQEPEVDILVA